MTTSPDITPSVLAHRQQPEPLDPAEVEFIPGILAHAQRVGFTIDQMQAALVDPRWINVVKSQPEPTNQHHTRYRYCGHGVAVIVEDHTAIAVIADDETKQPLDVAA